MDQNKPTLYLSHTCNECLEVVDYLHAEARSDVAIVWVHHAIDAATMKQEYILLASGLRTSSIPGVPALIHGEKLLVGKEVVAYLRLNKQL